MNRDSAWFRRRRTKRRGQKWKRAHGTDDVSATRTQPETPWLSLIYCSKNLRWNSRAKAASLRKAILCFFFLFGKFRAIFTRSYSRTHSPIIISHSLFFFFFFFVPFSPFILHVYSPFCHSRSSGCSTRDTFAIRSLRGIIRFGWCIRNVTFSNYILRTRSLFETSYIRWNWFSYDTMHLLD